MLRSTVVSVVGAILLTALLTAVLHARVALSVEDRPAAPVPVVAATYSMQTYFDRESSYLGLVRAGRRTMLGFELPGLLANLAVREGSAVNAGDVIASLDDTQLQARKKATEARLEQAKIELERAKLKASRQKNLEKTGAVSQEAYDDTRLIARALESRVKAVQAELDSIDIDLHKSTLHAPYAGVVAQRLLDEGSVVSAGAPLVRLLETGVREAHIGVTVEHIDQLRTGVNYALTVRGKPLQAPLQNIRPDVDPVTRTATAIFTLPPESDLLDGEPIALSLPQRVHMVGGWLPVSALLDGQRGVWTVLKINAADNGLSRVEREAVEVLEIQGEQAFVRGTLSDGDQVVGHGVHKIVPGTLVTVVEP